MKTDSNIVPADPNTILSSEINDGEAVFAERLFYEEAVGNMMSIMVCTRPDIAFVVGQCCPVLSGSEANLLESSKGDYGLPTWYPQLLMINGGPVSCRLLASIGCDKISPSTLTVTTN